MLPTQIVVFSRKTCKLPYLGFHTDYYTTIYRKPLQNSRLLLMNQVVTLANDLKLSLIATTFGQKLTHNQDYYRCVNHYILLVVMNKVSK